MTKCSNPILVLRVSFVASFITETVPMGVWMWIKHFILRPQKEKKKRTTRGLKALSSLCNCSAELRNPSTCITILQLHLCVSGVWHGLSKEAHVQCPGKHLGEGIQSSKISISAVNFLMTAWNLCLLAAGMESAPAMVSLSLQLPPMGFLCAMVDKVGPYSPKTSPGCFLAADSTCMGQAD